MIVDDDFANAVLDALAGPGLAAGLPDTMWVALYDGDPRDLGIEVTGGAYARLGPIDMTDVVMWPAADFRLKLNGLRIDGPTLSGPFAAPATWAALVDTSSGAPTVTGYGQQLPAPYGGRAGERLSLAAGGIAIDLADFGGF